MSQIVKEKTIPYNLEQSKIILQGADDYYKKEAIRYASIRFKPIIFHTLKEIDNKTLITTTCSNTGTGPEQEAEVQSHLRLFNYAFALAIDDFKLLGKMRKPIYPVKTVSKKEASKNYNVQKSHSPLLDKIMYELEDFAYMFPIMAFVIGGLGVYEFFSEPFSFGTIRDVFIAGIFVYVLMKASRKIIDYNFIPPENASANTEDRDSEFSENTDDITAYIASELIDEHKDTFNSEDKDHF